MVASSFPASRNAALTEFGLSGSAAAMDGLPWPRWPDALSHERHDQKCALPPDGHRVTSLPGGRRVLARSSSVICVTIVAQHAGSSCVVKRSINRLRVVQDPSDT